MTSQQIKFKNHPFSPQPARPALTSGPNSQQFWTMGLARLPLVLAMGAALALGGFISTAGPETQSPDGQRDSTALLEQIEREWPVGVARDSQGYVVSVILSSKEATDQNVRLLTNIVTLRSLAFSCSRVRKQPSGEAIQSLQHAPNLKALTIQCSGEIPEDVFGGVLKLTQLEALTFTATWPPKEKGYTPLKNLPLLRSLTIYYPDYPGMHTGEDISTLADLKQLKNLEIFQTQLQETNYHPLLNNYGLTNLNVVSGSWKLQIQRNSK
jgi:hypothetical protein